MFIGREKELKALNRMYKKDSFQMAIIYGRRRVGKTKLIQEFIKGKKAVFFSAIESTGEKNLEQLSQSIFSETLGGLSSLPSFKSFQDAFDYLMEYSTREKLILVIDEYPYLAENEKSISSILQNTIDNKFSKTNMMIILCGSSMSFMEEQVLGYKSPLYGRRTGQLLIKPFDYRTSSLFVPSYSPYEKAIVYGITGGIPKYLELVDETLSLKENIIDLFLTPSAYLFEEPSNLLKQELREPALYNAIIESIAKGATKVNEIAGASKMDTSKASIYLKTLISLGIVKKVTPLTEEKSKKKTYYKLEDNMFLFWYRFVMPNMYIILNGDPEYLYDTRIEPDLNHFMGHIFENMCSQYLTRISLEKSHPFTITSMGQWWGTDPSEKVPVEIDIMAINDQEDKIFFGECKFRNEPLGIEVYKSLLKKSRVIPYHKGRFYGLFSKSSFTKALIDEADQNEDITLVTLSDMY